ncbi:MAG: flippase-like domain-containing protein [Thermoplasmata archaeon]|nr:MAG: flippase-like domain-containing protein [Thermoplasmata archaeon]
MKRRLLFLVVVSVLLIAAMVIITDPREMGDILVKTDFTLIMCVIALYMINGVVKAVRWFLLIRLTGGKVPLSRVYLFLLIGLMINNTTPGRIGGEPVRAYLLKQEDATPMGHGISTIFIERIMDLIVLTSMALIGIALILPLLLSAESNMALMLLSFVPVIALIVILLYIASHPALLKRSCRGVFRVFRRFSKKGWLVKIEMGLTSFLDSFIMGVREIRRALLVQKKRGAAFVGLTVAIWVNEAARIYLILISLPDVKAPSFGAVLIASSVATVFGAFLPIGALHATLVSSVFAALGVDMASATTAGILTIMTSIWLSIPLGIAAMFIVGLKIDTRSGALVKKDQDDKEHKEGQGG